MRATAVLGVPTEDRMIYDNLDLLVHPMTVSFTDSQLTQLWVPPPSSLSCMWLGMPKGICLCMSVMS